MNYFRLCGRGHNRLMDINSASALYQYMNRFQMVLRLTPMEKSIKGEKNMKKKLMRMPKVVTILVAILIVAIFLGSMDVAAFFLANTVSLPGYGNSMIAEFAQGWLHSCFYVCLVMLEY